MSLLDNKAEGKENALKEQLKELIERKKAWEEQYRDIVLSEENSAEKDFQKVSREYEVALARVKELEIEKEKAKLRWDDARRESRNFLKRIQSLENEIAKIKKKLNLDVEENKEQKNLSQKFIIFRKDTFVGTDDEEEDSLGKKEKREKKKNKKEKRKKNKD